MSLRRKKRRLHLITADVAAERLTKQSSVSRGRVENLRNPDVFIVVWTAHMCYLVVVGAHCSQCKIRWIK